jgi:hypothetical protein
MRRGTALFIPLLPRCHCHILPWLPAECHQGIVENQVIGRSFNQRTGSGSSLPDEEMVVGLLTAGSIKAGGIDPAENADFFGRWINN